MKVTPALVALSALAFPSAAFGQLPDLTTMTCQQATAFVAARGSVTAIYEHHPAAGPLYKRFVASKRYCPFRTEFKRRSVRTIDSPNCIIGGVCKELDDDEIDEINWWFPVF